MYAILTIIIIIILLNIVYLISRIRKFNIIKNINNKKLSWIITLIPILIIIMFGIIDFINTLVCIIHFVLFWIIFDFVFYIIKKISKKEPKIYLSGAITIFITFIYLLYGVISVYNVRKTVYNINTNKNIKSLKIAQITDSHLGTTFDGYGLANYFKEINKQKPDIVVVTGDYVDDSTKKKI